MKRQIVWITTAVITSVTFGVNAADENVDREAKAKMDSAITTLIMANELAKKGIDQKDPLLLITSAKLLKLNAVEQKKREKNSKGGKSTEKENKEKYTPELLLEYAQDWSGDNEVYASLIDQVASLRTRGRVGGGAEHVDAVNAGAIDYYNIGFYGREWAEVAVIGDGDTDLDLYVYDDSGNLICEDTDSTDTTYCSWLPRFDGMFQIEVKNFGEVYNEYLLLTN